MVVPIADAPVADAAPASAPAAAPAAAAAPATTETATTPVSAPSGAPAGADAQGAQSSAASAEPDPLTELAEFTADEKQAFGEQINALPPELQKSFKKLLTTKTQTIAGVVKTVQAQAQLLQALHDDPIGTANDIIAKHQAAGAQPGQPGNAATTTSMAAGAAASEAVAQLKEALGPELDFLADKLAPALEKLATEAARKGLEPVLKGAEKAEHDARVTEARTTATEFVGRHRDWEKHAARMTELAQEVQFADSVSAGDRLERLYTLASAGAKDGDTAAAVVDRINASAAAADSAPAQGVPASRVNDKNPPMLSLREAFEQSKRELAARA